MGLVRCEEIGVSIWGRTLHDPLHEREALRRGRYGLIEVVDGRLQAIHLRHWPRIVSALEIEWLGLRWHANRPGNRCLLHYAVPRRFANYLVLKYVVSYRDCTFATFRRSLEVLDAVAQLKRSDAILCDVWNARISDRLLARWGWQPHKPSRWHRHYIKRFYGAYPPTRSQWAETAAAAQLASFASS